MTVTQSAPMELELWHQELSTKDAMGTLKWASSMFGEKIKFASSLGLEDQVITDMIAQVAPTVGIFTLDTGRLFPETYDLVHKIEDRYKIKIDIFFPHAEEVEKMVREHGVNLFRSSVENRKLCCRIRKIHPLKRALAGLDAWVCGLRKEQSQNRQHVKKIEWDEANNLVKINPLCNWDEEEVLNYIKTNNVPYNVLHDRNYLSIGCACCTRAVKAGENSRAGRWWWEQEDKKKECGLHIVDGKIVRQGG